MEVDILMGDMFLIQSWGCKFIFCLPFSAFSELIYKEVMDLEERTKNGVIRGQPAPLGWLQ